MEEALARFLAKHPTLATELATLNAHGLGIRLLVEHLAQLAGHDAGFALIPQSRLGGGPLYGGRTSQETPKGTYLIFSRAGMHTKRERRRILESARELARALKPKGVQTFVVSSVIRPGDYARYGRARHAYQIPAVIERAESLRREKGNRQNVNAITLGFILPREAKATIPDTKRVNRMARAIAETRGPPQHVSRRL